MTQCIAPFQAPLSFTISWILLKFMFIELLMPYNHVIFCHPFLFLASVFLRIRVFSNESALCIRWPKFWCFSFSISPSSEYSGLISFSIDWFDLLAVCIVTQLCPTLCHPLDNILSVSSLLPLDFSGKNTGMGGHFLLQGIFLTQVLNLGWFNWQVEFLTSLTQYYILTVIISHLHRQNIIL